MKTEKIVCAAVKKWVGDDVSIEVCVQYPDKYKKQESIVNWVGYKKGFITNKNRFVDAKEAMDIAINNDQLKVIKEKESEYFKYSQIGERQEVLDAIISDILSLQDLYVGRDLRVEDLY